MRSSSKRFVQRALWAAACLATTPAWAASAAAEVSIQTFGIGDGGEGMYIWQKTTPAMAIACPAARFLLPTGTPLFDTDIAILMSAAAQKLPVILVYDGAACVSGNWKVIAIRMNVP